MTVSRIPHKAVYMKDSY